MKKVFVVPLIAIAAFVSQAVAADYTPCTGSYAGYCYWPPSNTDPQGGCFQINMGVGDAKSCATEYDNCITNGTVYNGVTYPSGTWGAGSKCESLGGQWAGVGNNPNFNNGIPIWCRWATSCHPLKSDTEKANCVADGSVYSNVPTTGIGDNKQCEGGTWTGEGRDPNLVRIGCCNWEGNGCFPVYDQTEWGDCSAEYRYASCPGDESGACTGSPMPILKINPNMGLVVATHGRALHISSDKNATVTLYTLDGQRVLSGKVSAGNKVFSLVGQNPGVYYAIVQSGSYTQTVNVVLK